ncbi:transposase [Saccharicrinis sp. 156]|uniref:transposase n=1 Tax=Saccharicrinis sp. 156 TaxID=3417574 RepID=UPI003D352AD1
MTGGAFDMISENLYIQYFCGLKEFTVDSAFDPSLFVEIRKRMGGKEFDAFNKIVIEKSERIKPPVQVKKKR